MEILEQEKKKALLSDEIGGQTYKVTMLDMGSYIGFRSRPWYAKAPEKWRAMSIDVTSPEKEGLHYESLVDDLGDLSRVILKTDDNRISRIRLYNDAWGQGIEDILHIDGHSYTYNPEQKTFVDEMGNVAPATQFSQYDLVDSMVALAATMEEEYAQQNEPIGDYATLVDYRTILIFLGNNLYYGDVWGANAAFPNGVTNGVCVNNLTLLVDGVTRIDPIPSPYDCHYTDWTFKKTTLTETVFYQIIVGEDGKPQVIDETYVAPEETTITLQPLNK